MSESVEATLARLVRLLESLGIDRYALTGGIAFGVWAEPRETRDLDVTAVLPPAAVLPLLAQFDGMRVGSGEMPDVVRFRLRDWDVDLFVAEDGPVCVRGIPTLCPWSSIGACSGTHDAGATSCSHSMVSRSFMNLSCAYEQVGCPNGCADAPDGGESMACR